MPSLNNVRSVVKKIASIDGFADKICFFGGAMPYIYYGEESGREHSDIDILVVDEYIDALREVLKGYGVYKDKRDSKCMDLDRDYGFKLFIDGVYVEFEPVSIKDGILSRYSFNPDNEVAGMEAIPFLDIGDFIIPIEIDGIKTYSESMEMIRADKDKYKREKDIRDIAFIDRYGIDLERYNRVVTCKKEASSELRSFEEIRKQKIQ